MMKSSRSLFVAFAAIALSAAVSVSATAYASDLPATVGVSTTAGAMMTDTGVTDLQIDVIPAKEAANNANVKAMLGSSPVAFEPGSPATALYYKGVCTIIVDTKAANQDINPVLARKMSKDDLMFFIAAHETAHCISHHRQAQELKELASGKKLSDTFLPKEVIAAGDAGTLNQATFKQILGSKAVVQREEAFADALAALYTRVKKENASNILAGIVNSRDTAASAGDDVHSTVTALRAAIEYPALLGPNDIVDVGHKLSM